ncbi:MAG: hypothetical protein ACYCT9_08690 [Leptospirillum sp.]
MVRLRSKSLGWAKFPYILNDRFIGWLGDFLIHTAGNSHLIAPGAIRSRHRDSWGLCALRWSWTRRFPPEGVPALPPWS